MIEHPWDTASCASKFWLLWLWPLLWKGSKTPLQEEYIFELPHHLKAQYLDAKWSRCLCWTQYQKSPPSVFWVLIRTYGWRYYLVSIIFTVWLGSLSVYPILTNMLFNWLSSDRGMHEGLLLSAALVASYLINCNAGCQWYQQTRQLGYEFRASAAMLVFRRTLCLSVHDMSKEQAMNLMQVDAERLFIFAQLSHLFYTALIVVAMASVHLAACEDLALAVLSIFVIVFTVFIQSVCTRVAAPARRRMQSWADKRMSLLAQILDAMHVLKMYGWTQELGRRVHEIRHSELRNAALYLAVRAFSSALLYLAVPLSMLAAIWMLRSRSEQLSAERVFLIFTIVGLARGPLGGVAMGASACVDGYTAFKRLNLFIAPSRQYDIFKADLTQREVCDSSDTCAPGGGLVAGKFTYSGHSFLLSVDLVLQPGELVAVCGPVAAGKSSVLLAMLGEMATQNGSFRLPPGVAYLAQAPWIRSGTVRNVIIQDLPLDEIQYWRAVRAAQLCPDFESWSSGENTYVGSRGVTISGGQRVRLGLAHVLYRCLMSEVDVVLMDDCLSAVDVHVARAICEEALLGIILDQQRAVVMVMNSNFIALRAASRVLALDDGLAVVHESADQWLESSNQAVRSCCFQTMADISARCLEDHTPATPSVAAVPMESKEARRLGSLQGRTFAYYFGSGSYVQGWCCLTFTIAVTAGVEVTRVYSDFFLGKWAERDESNSENESETDFHIFLLWVGMSVAAAFFRSFVFVALAIRSSRKIHRRLLERLLSAPTSYFDVTPPGRILGYFSKDLDAIDALLPQYGLDLAQDMTLLLGVVFVCVWSTPPAAFAMVPLLFVFYKIRTFFSCTARETKRLDGITRGSLYSAIGDIADGLITLRAHRQAANLVKYFQSLLDHNGKIFFQTSLLQPWCILVLDSLGATIVLITSVFCVLMRSSLSASASTMAISYSLMTRGKLQFCIRLSIEAENQMISVERLQSFERELPQERQGGDTVHDNWPASGSVSFKEVQMRYRPCLPLVLQGLTLDVQPGSKVGVVGRTGSGKSSLLSVLLGTVEIEAGAITIDGINISSVPLHRLRAAVSIIPQDPTLWSGTLAENLDPLGILPDKILLDALHKVSLAPAVADMGGLHAKVDNRGSNLSLGQRQLLCIARCIARRSRIVLVDEATACVDGGTDSLVQDAFRTQFQGCTMLVVAHRIQTILDADQIAVLDAGRVVETGAPAALSAKADSCFAAFVDTVNSSGDAVAEFESKHGMEAPSQSTVASI